MTRHLSRQYVLLLLAMTICIGCSIEEDSRSAPPRILSREKVLDLYTLQNDEDSRGRILTSYIDATSELPNASEYRVFVGTISWSTMPLQGTPEMLAAVMRCQLHRLNGDQLFFLVDPDSTIATLLSGNKRGALYALYYTGTVEDGHLDPSEISLVAHLGASCTTRCETDGSDD